jgi:DNA-binding LacI/PurR family transcriptional regulator
VLREGRHHPRLQEVARLAGVSPSTVSRVVNEKGYVRESTRDAVERAIAQIEYVPNTMARNLRQQRGDFVALIIPRVEGFLFGEPFFAELFDGITAGLSDLDLQPVLLRPRSKREIERTVSYVRSGRVEAAILVGLAADDPTPGYLAGRGVPVVVVGRIDDQTVSSVDCANRGGAREATAHLVSIGRRRIATITGRLDSPAGIDRLAGYHAALEAAGLARDDRLEANGGFRAETAAECTRELLERVPDLDGLFAANDTMATSALRVILDSGRRVPEDVAIVGFDDNPVASTTRPSLSSVVQPIERMGREAARIVAAGIDGTEDAPRHVVFSASLVIRESSGAAAAPTS